MSDNSSFMPEDYVAKKIARRTNIIFISLFGVVFFVVAAAFFVTDRQRTEVRDELTKVNMKVEEKRAQLEQIESLNAQKQEMKRKANVTAALRDRVPKSAVFAELSNNMPATMSLTELKIETEAVKGQPAPRTAIQREKLRQASTGQEEIQVVPTRVEIGLAGVAPTDVEISEYIGTLNAHPMFSDVTLQYVEEMKIEESMLRKFRIQMAQSVGFDMAQFEPTRSEGGLKNDPTGDTLQINSEGEMVKPTESLGSVETEVN